MRRIVVLFLILYLHFSLVAQNQEPIATINKSPITYGELLYAYQKNRDTTNRVVFDSLRLYLEQYIDFKLKVAEARDLGFHLNPDFQAELQGYFNQVKKPYLENPSLEEAKLKLFYDRLKWELNAAHILLKVSPDAAPKDTLAAYKKLDSIKNLATNHDKFVESAKEFSQDGSARKGGDLGWFTAFHMVAPFEDAAFGLHKGEVSEVFRTRFGYHIIYLKDKRPTRGKLGASHIYFAKSIHGSALAQQKAETAYKVIAEGEQWLETAKNLSDDKRTAANGGRLPLSGIRQLPDDFFSEIYKIERIGNISRPFETATGWHIARLEEIEPLFDYEIKKKEIAIQLKRSGRNQYSEKEVISNLKSGKSFTQDSLRFKTQLTQIIKSPNKYANEVVFSYENVDVKWRDMLKEYGGPLNIEDLKEGYKIFEAKRVLDIEDSIAPTKYPNYGYLLQEFEEGLLLFNVMQENIWAPATEDTLGLGNFFQANRKEYTDVKLTGQRLSVSEKLLPKVLSKLKQTNELDRGKLVSQFPDAELKIAKSTLMGREIPNFDARIVEVGSWIRIDEGSLLFVEEIETELLDLKDCRGQVLTDYQDFLNKDWVSKLRKRARIKVNEKRLKQLTDF